MFNADSLSEMLKQKGIIPKCSMCGANNFTHIERPVLLPFFDVNGISFPTPGITAGVLICNNCTHVMLFGHNSDKLKE